MEKNNTQKGIVQFAMEAGAYMGLYFVVKFIFAVLSLNYPFCNVVSTIMLLFVPLVVFFMMRRFSNQNEGGSYFSQLWMMGILLFFFALSRPQKFKRKCDIFDTKIAIRGILSLK